MADFLASFGIAPEPAAPSTTRGCASIEELQTDLRNAVAANVTATRASHVSTAFQLRDTARFELNFSENENEALAGLSNIDPSLGGLRSTPVEGEAAAGGQSVRVVNASETLRNQPPSDPALQKAVAKHIVAAVSEADSSHWVIREVSRQGQGWTFTYHCKDSVQQWTRQNAKAPEQHVIGEWYYKDPDPILDNRPAFDCRGTLTIAFPRNGRSISVKYEHTPIHQTVAQLKEIFKPAPRPQPPKKTAESKTPKSSRPKTSKESKAPKTPKTPKTPRTPKAGKDGESKEKKKSASTGGEGSKPRKRKKKNDGEPQSVGNESSSLFVDADNPAYGTPPATASNAGSVAAGQSSTQAVAVAANANFPNVTAAEAARRRGLANKLLSEAGVNPATLSADQFTIFANQSPELQEDSLAMLVKYGAERLRIVQPTNEVPGQQPTPAPSTQPSATGAITTKELVPQHRNSLPDTPESSKRKAAANGQAKAPKSGNMGKSRLVCYQCKERRVKCSKERPTCEECVNESRSCEYPPQPTRASRKKSEATVVESDDDGDEDDDDGDGPEDQEAPAAEASNTSNWQMPVADMLGPTVEPPIHNPQPEAPGFYQSATGLPLQHDESHGRTDMSAASGLALLQNNTYGSDHLLPNPLQQQVHSNGHGIDPTTIQKGRGSQTSTQPGPTASPTYPYQVSATQGNTQLGHRRSTSQQGASPQVAAATTAQAQGRASPAQMDQARARSRQSQQGQTRTPVNNGADIGAAPAAHPRTANPLRESTGHTTRLSSQNTGNSANDGSADRIPYQPYSHGNVPQQARNNAALSLPTTVPSGTEASYASAPAPVPAGNQWNRNNTQQGNDRSYDAANSYSHTANNQGTASNMSLRSSSQQQQQPGAQRNYQSFGSQQQQQMSQQAGNQQQNTWFGVNNTNNGGTYNSYGQYWQN